MITSTPGPNDELDGQTDTPSFSSMSMGFRWQDDSRRNEDRDVLLQ
jgi:hypothetical protein